MGERERVRELQREAEYERVSDHLEYLGNPFDQMDLSTKKQHALYLYYEILKVLPSSAFVHDSRIRSKYQPSRGGGTCSTPAKPHCLQNPKWPPGSPKIADGL